MTSWSHSSLCSQAGIGMIQVLFLLISLSAILMVSVVMMDTAQSPSSVSVSNERMERLKAAISEYRAHNGSNPATLDALVTATGSPCAPDTNPSSSSFRSLRGWCGPYIDQEFPGSELFKRDGWGVVFQYNGTMITSCGANRVCGDADDLSLAL